MNTRLKSKNSKKTEIIVKKKLLNTYFKSQVNKYTETYDDNKRQFILIISGEFTLLKKKFHQIKFIINDNNEELKNVNRIIIDKKILSNDIQLISHKRSRTERQCIPNIAKELVEILPNYNILVNKSIIKVEKPLNSIIYTSRNKNIIKTTYLNKNKKISRIIRKLTLNNKNKMNNTKNKKIINYNNNISINSKNMMMTNLETCRKKLQECSLHYNKYGLDYSARPKSFEPELINLNDDKQVNNNKNELTNETNANNEHTENDVIKENMNIKSSLNDDVITSYTFKLKQGRQNSIQIYIEDYKTLDESVYLNDKIIMFYLKFLHNESTSEELKNKLIIMDTYFFQKLSKDENGSMDSPLINYDSVKKWTKNFSFFDNDFVLIPINEDEHWSLIILCYPIRIKKCFDNYFDKENNEKSLLSDEYYPSIINLDSFYNGNLRCRNIFKKYLFYEYAVKNNITHDDNEIVDIIQNNKSFIFEFSPLVPKQPNTYDCGIYLLAYSELFLLEPNYLIEHLRLSNNDLTNWFTYDFVQNKRENIQLLLQSISNKSNEDLQLAIKDFFDRREELLKLSYKIELNLSEYAC